MRILGVNKLSLYPKSVFTNAAMREVPLIAKIRLLKEIVNSRSGKSNRLTCNEVIIVSNPFNQVSDKLAYNSY